MGLLTEKAGLVDPYLWCEKISINHITLSKSVTAQEKISLGINLFQYIG